jgi:cell wall-associated NlpC family hydrolase
VASNNRHTPRLVRLAVVTSITAFTVGMLPGTGQAAPATPVSTPKTASDAASVVAKLGDQLEILSEDINAQAISVTKLKKDSAKATTVAKTADKRYAQLSSEVSAIVRSTYISAPFGQFTTLMTSGSPQDFLDQLSTLERMSEQRGKVIGDAIRSKQQADRARTTSAALLRKAQTAYSTMQAKNKSLTGQIAKYKALYNSLNAQERASLVAPGGTADRGGRPSVPTGLPPAPNPKAQVAVQAALAQLGKPYVWGASGTASSDCSGLTMYAWGQAGVGLPHQSAQQYSYGTHVAADVATLKPGDLLFFYSPIHHVAMYIGNGQMVHAPDTGDVVRTASVDWGNLVGATRL